MTYEQVKNSLAPCGINCSKCFSFSEGDIKIKSKELKNLLGNFDIYARRFVELLDEPVFKKYPDFKDMLSYLSLVDCKGCRKDNCRLFISCKVRDCYSKKNIDFCFQCEEFPCNNTGFDEHLYKRYIEINMKMKEIGVENYYNEIKDKPRY
jgi:hypothetical protein